MNRPFAWRLKPRQQEHQAHLRGLPTPARQRASGGAVGEPPQGGLVPFVAANLFAGSASSPERTRGAGWSRVQPGTRPQRVPDRRLPRQAMTLRMTSPASMARKASLTPSSLMVFDTIEPMSRRRVSISSTKRGKSRRTCAELMSRSGVYTGYPLGAPPLPPAA